MRQPKFLEQLAGKIWSNHLCCHSSVTGEARGKEMTTERVGPSFAGKRFGPNFCWTRSNWHGHPHYADKTWSNPLCCHFLCCRQLLVGHDNIEDWTKFWGRAVPRTLVASHSSLSWWYRRIELTFAAQEIVGNGPHLSGRVCLLIIFVSPSYHLLIFFLKSLSHRHLLITLLLYSYHLRLPS